MRIWLCGVVFTAVCAAGWGGEADAPAGVRSRCFEFTYRAWFKEIPDGAKSVDLWIPLPQTTAHQTIHKFVCAAGVPSDAGPLAPIMPDVATEPASGNRMAHWRLIPSQAKTFKAALTFACERLEVSARNMQRAGELSAEEKASLERFLRPDTLVPVGGEFQTVADGVTKDAKTPLERAKAAYDYTVGTMTYDKPQDKPGWGRGSTKWACDARFGNCTDFHALIMSIARTKGIPARFEIGFPLPAVEKGKPETTAGAVGGYHCWAYLYLGGVGWIPVDASEAQRNPKLKEYYFGNLTADRIQFSAGRDVNLVPKQTGEALNFFINPYAEADGKPIAVERGFSFRDVKDFKEPEEEPEKADAEKSPAKEPAKEATEKPTTSPRRPPTKAPPASSKKPGKEAAAKPTPE